MKKKCTWGDSLLFSGEYEGRAMKISVKPDGVHELDPCVYEEVETVKNATVHVLRCKKCGHVEIEWERNND